MTRSMCIAYRVAACACGVTAWARAAADSMHGVACVRRHGRAHLRRPRRIGHSALDDRHVDARRQRHLLELAHARPQRGRADEHDGQLRLDHLVVEAQLRDDEVGARVQRRDCHLEQNLRDAGVRELARARAHDRDADALEARRERELRDVGGLRLLWTLCRDGQRARAVVQRDL